MPAGNEQKNHSKIITGSKTRYTKKILKLEVIEPCMYLRYCFSSNFYICSEHSYNVSHSSVGKCFLIRLKEDILDKEDIKEDIHTN